MTGRLKSRLWITACMGLCMLALAVAPRPARPAVPARPVQQGAKGPLAGKIILVDAGHGGTDGDARAKDSGVWEKEINLQVASLVKKLLTDGGRVLGCTAVADSLPEAIRGAYEIVSQVSFANAYYRHDIGARAMKALEV